ncbi:signal peptide peptidase SppA [Candidatus Liberibacter brunswickensis]|uniref:signal peptide peptidase SppA n=1 Tax=Candidatus Liberibacter brunswickensis TaxID=1968796 RepID=UPI002FDF6C03
MQMFLEKIKKIKTRSVISKLILLILAYICWNYIYEDKSPHVARISILGTIDDNPELLERIANIDKDDSVKALIVSLSSPGGSAYAGEQIFNAIQKVKLHKPVVAEARSMAASAAYMIACASNTIVASNSSIIGSIGVILQFPNVKHLLDKLGVSYKTIKSSPLKGEPSPFSETNPEGIKKLQNLVSDSYHWFVKIVSKSRNIPYDKMLTLSDGSIWTGSRAKKLGLVDTIGGRDEVWNSLYELGLDKNVTKIKDWNPPKEYWFFNFKNKLTGIIDEVITSTEKTNMQGLLSIWNPQN